MKVRTRQAGTGALWVFAPLAGDWNSLGHQMLTHSNTDGKGGTEFGN
jgi:hypothetical protein